MSDIGEPTGNDPTPFTTDDCRCPVCAALEAKVFANRMMRPQIHRPVAPPLKFARDEPAPLHPLQAITDKPVYRVGDYIADYSPLTEAELAQVPAESEELFRNSKPVNRKD